MTSLSSRDTKIASRTDQRPPSRPSVCCYSLQHHSGCCGRPSTHRALLVSSATMSLLRSTRHIAGALLRPMAHTQPAAPGRARYYATDKDAQATDMLTSKQQPEQQQTTSSRPEEEWTEVFTETGQPYYWNQKTGETTDVGEPKPKTRFRDQSYQGSGAEQGPFQEAWREPLEPDRTQVYAFMGVTGGILLGWATQYMH